MTKELNIGIVGLGTVGSGVIKSIEKNKEYFKNNYDVKFNIIGISANSKNKERSFDVDIYNCILLIEYFKPNVKVSFHIYIKSKL